jgi:hypothetical protein
MIAKMVGAERIFWTRDEPTDYDIKHGHVDAYEVEPDSDEYDNTEDEAAYFDARWADDYDETEYDRGRMMLDGYNSQGNAPSFVAAPPVGQESQVTEPSVDSVTETSTDVSSEEPVKADDEDTTGLKPQSITNGPKSNFLYSDADWHNILFAVVHTQSDSFRSFAMYVSGSFWTTTHTFLAEKDDTAFHLEKFKNWESTGQTYFRVASISDAKLRCDITNRADAADFCRLNVANREQLFEGGQTPRSFKFGAAPPLGAQIWCVNPLDNGGHIYSGNISKVLPVTGDSPYPKYITDCSNGGFEGTCGLPYFCSTESGGMSIMGMHAFGTDTGATTNRNVFYGIQEAARFLVTTKFPRNANIAKPGNGPAPPLKKMSKQSTRGGATTRSNKPASPRRSSQKEATGVGSKP